MVLIFVNRPGSWPSEQEDTAPVSLTVVLKREFIYLFIYLFITFLYRPIAEAPWAVHKN